MRPGLATSTPTRHYTALDGLRGVAAIGVVGYHAGVFLGPLWPASAYLAVDFFFVLSGFVIAHAYDDKIGRRMSGDAFFAKRIVRLFPLYYMGSAITVAATIVSVFVTRDATHWTASTLLIAVVLGAVMVPWPPGQRMFPLNAPGWSLLLELLANAVYATGVSQSGWLVRLVPALAALGLLGEIGVHGMVNGGSEWIEPWWSAPVWGGLRVAYSFPVGLLLYRHRAALRVPTVPVTVLGPVLAVLLWFDPTGFWRALYDAAFVLVISPSLVAIASHSEPTAPRVCGFLGVISYPIYAVHQPIINILNGAIRRLPHGVIRTEWQPWVGIALIAVLIAVAALANRMDVRARHWLARRPVG